MANKEYINPEGLRMDGRRPDELRKIRCKLGIFARSDGSAYIEQGNTKVLVAVYGPREVVHRSKAMHDRAVINCEYHIAPFSTGERKKKRKGDRRAAEIGLIIRQTFESVIHLNIYPRSQIDIYIQVLQADGGERCAAINATTLALINAGIPMKDFVTSCSAGYFNGQCVLDVNHVEDGAGGPDLPLALLPQTGKIIMLQMDSKLPVDMFEKVVKLAEQGARAIHAVLSKEVENYSLGLLENRGTA